MSRNLLVSSSSGPGAIGNVRFNPNKLEMEIYDGFAWIPVPGNAEPQTWREWLDYFAGQFIDHGGIDHKLMYIQLKMHERFPGPYVVKHLGHGRFDLDFYTPADETWWRLKYG